VWHLVAIYGTSYNELKLEFFAELHEVMDGLTYPVLLGGDFNLVRSTADKNNGIINNQFTYLFNDWINKWCLMEINVANRKFTWSNNQDDPIFATIDRIFVSLNWDAHFPLSMVTALPRVGSDHTPLVLDTGAWRVTSPRIFRFEKWWLDHPNLKKMVIDTWNTSVPGKTAMDIWMNKGKLFRKKARGWSINIEADTKKKKRELLLEFDILDVFSERNQIDDGDKIRMEEIREELALIWSKEETVLWQRSRDRRIIDGDKNNAYFHAMANHRHRKNHLSELVGDNGPVYTTQEMLGVATSYYKNLLCFENKHNICLGPSFWEEDELVTQEENEHLQKSFSEEEIKEAIFGSYAHGAPGPDGLSFLFYQTFWEVIKTYFMALVRDFEEGKLDLQL
uniref:Endonuclease/exonuclease/phosphatase domain-containing protein n=1 Tax=Aegilops tauschii subsp. strangulata TaxID=200361 RepID=A0A453Q9V0_AEGTS